MKRLILFLFVFMTISGLQELFGQSTFPLVSEAEATVRLATALDGKKSVLGPLTAGTADYDRAERLFDLYARALGNLQQSQSVDVAVTAAHRLAYSGLNTRPMAPITKVEQISALDTIYALLKL